MIKKILNYRRKTSRKIGNIDMQKLVDRDELCLTKTSKESEYEKNTDDNRI